MVKIESIDVFNNIYQSLTKYDTDILVNISDLLNNSDMNYDVDELFVKYDPINEDMINMALDKLSADEVKTLKVLKNLSFEFNIVFDYDDVVVLADYIMDNLDLDESDLIADAVSRYNEDTSRKFILVEGESPVERE